MEFSRQECWSGLLPFPSPGDFLNIEIEPASPALAGDPPGKPVPLLVHLGNKENNGT